MILTRYRKVAFDGQPVRSFQNGQRASDAPAIENIEFNTQDRLQRMQMDVEVN